MMNLISSLVSRAASVFRTVLGAPHYQRYLAHMRAAQPGDRVMSETEFVHTRMNDRYNRAGSRCC